MVARDTLAVADRLERAGLPSGPARAVAQELHQHHEALRQELVTRDDFDLALERHRAHVQRDLAESRSDLQRDLAGLRADVERDPGRLRVTVAEQANRTMVRLGVTIGLATTVVGGLGGLF